MYILGIVLCFKGEYYMDVHSGDLYVLRESIIWMYILGIVLCFK